jgi:teichuronic acid biosynthesis glycosyltransferase TuaG
MSCFHNLALGDDQIHPLHVVYAEIIQDVLRAQPGGFQPLGHHGRDSDDLWHPHKLEIQIFAMLESGSAFSHTSFGYINDEGEEIKKSLITSDESVTYDYLLKHTEISCLTTIYDAKVLGKMYMPDIRRSQDYVLWLSILKRTNSLPIKEVLAFYRLHENNISKNKFKKITLHWKVLRKYENLPLLRAPSKSLQRQ